jgi:hypothetical protein
MNIDLSDVVTVRAGAGLERRRVAAHVNLMNGTRGTVR